MKGLRRFRYGWTLALFSLVIIMVMPAAVSARVWTDLEDYSPGDIVAIHGDNSDGAGYLAGETVHVEVSGPNGYSAACDAIADGDGVWSCEVMLWPDYLAVGAYSYTATGQSSGVSQSGKFTDGNLKFHETGLPPGITWSVTWNGTPKSDTAPTDVVFGGSGGTAGFTVTSPLSGGTGIQYLATPASGTATQPATGNTTVNIAFTTQYQVSFAVNPSGGGSTSPSATAYYNAGAEVPVSATAYTGYAFSSWSTSGSITFANASSASTTATINGTGTITANFSLTDSTPPTTSIALSPATPNGANGWYVSNVHVTVSAADNMGGSGVAETSCVLDPASAPATFDAIPSGCAYTGAGADVTTDGQHIVYAASKDNAGNKETPVSQSFKIDKTAPTIAWSSPEPADGGSYYFGSVPAAPTCEASDSLSGPNGCTVTGYGTTVGSHTLTATAYDVAGNKKVETRTYSVLAWTLKGFYQPVDMTPDGQPTVWNTVKGGSTVPLKFEIFAGPTELTDVAAVKSFVTKPVACPATNMLADEIEFVTTGGTALRYDWTVGQFIQNWQTPKNPGKCYAVTMTTQDASFLTAYFKLK